MFDLLGVEWEFSDNLFQMLQNFTCRMYSSRPGTNSINELRYRLFCSKRCNIESNYHLALIACINMRVEQTRKQECGGEKLSTALKFRVP